MEEFAPGTARVARSFLAPSFQWTGFADTNGPGNTKGSRLETQSTYLGNLLLQRVRRNSQTNLAYAGGGIFYSRGSGGSASLAGGVRTFHRLGVSESVRIQRWELTLADNLIYLPESPFGFAGFGGLQGYGYGQGETSLANAPILNTAVQPSQTILTGPSRRLGNTVALQAGYEAGRRSTITASGIYGTLHFLDSGFVDSNYWTLLTGYNFAASRRDTLSLFYAHSLFRFDFRSREFLSRGIHFAYGHRLTGRVALRLSAGPTMNDTTKALGGFTRSVFWSSFDSLQYQGAKSHVDITYLRATTGGSGVLLGAESDVVRMVVSRQILRKFSASLSAGHAYNRSLTESLDQEVLLNRRLRYEAWEGGATLAREFGPRASVYLNYSIQRQESDNSLCFESTCGRVFLRHVGGIGIDWHPRPIRLD